MNLIFKVYTVRFTLSFLVNHKDLANSERFIVLTQGVD